MRDVLAWMLCGLHSLQRAMRETKDAPADRRRPGRPPGDPLARRTLAVIVRVTQAERDALHEAAEAEDASLAEWMRDLAIDRARDVLGRDPGASK